jgi:hypothetical protein
MGGGLFQAGLEHPGQQREGLREQLSAHGDLVHQLRAHPPAPGSEAAAGKPAALRHDGEDHRPELAPAELAIAPPVDVVQLGDGGREARVHLPA